MGRHNDDGDSDDGLALGAQISRSRATGKAQRPTHTYKEEEIDDNSSAGSNADEDESSHKKKRKREAPVELPANRAVKRHRTVVPVARIERRDPRFEDTSGKFDQEIFDQAYGFLGEYKDSEIQALKKEVKDLKDPEERKEMLAVLKRLQQQRADEQRAAAVRKVAADTAKESRAHVSAGGKAFYLKKRDLRELAAVERFKTLEARGGNALDKALQKRRKKIASKDRKKLPMLPFRPPSTSSR